MLLVSLLFLTLLLILVVLYKWSPAACIVAFLHVAGFPTVAFSLLLDLLLRAIILSSLLLLVAGVASVACFNVVACVPVIAVISAVVGVSGSSCCYCVIAREAFGT